MNRPLKLNLIALSAALFAVTGSAQDDAGSAGSAAPVGMVEQPCAPAITMPPSVRELLVELFMEPRKLASADLERLMGKRSVQESSLKETRELSARGLAGIVPLSRRKSGLRWRERAPCVSSSWAIRSPKTGRLPIPDFFKWKLQSRHQRPDYTADAGAVSGGRGHAEAEGGFISWPEPMMLPEIPVRPARRISRTTSCRWRSSHARTTSA